MLEYGNVGKLFDHAGVQASSPARRLVHRSRIRGGGSPEGEGGSFVDPETPYLRVEKLLFSLLPLYR
jgi:hypothetical protein